MIPSSVLLVFLALLVLVMPLACRRMTPLQQRRWAAGLVVGCAVVLTVTATNAVIAYAVAR